MGWIATRFRAAVHHQTFRSESGAVLEPIERFGGSSWEGCWEDCGAGGLGECRVRADQVRSSGL